MQWPKIALTTIGCKLNQSEIQDLKQDLIDAGYLIVDKNEPHDLHIINACSITHGAEQITRQKIREAKSKNPKLQIFVMGCLNQPIPEINKVFKNKKEVLKFIKKIYKNTQIRNSKFIIHNSRTRVLIKVQDGCNFNCAYCIITKFRGQSKSISPNKIISQIKQKEKQGAKEIVLVGVNILLYKFGTTDLAALVKRILDETKIPRIRFSSLDPRLVNPTFLNLFRNKRICPHLHLSLQSGSNKILKLMNRHYTAQRYLQIIKTARKINPLTSITTDIIIGFPGETEKDFQDTLNLVKKIDFLKIHIFPYSARGASKEQGQINESVKKQRFIKLNKLAEKQSQKFLKKMKDKIMPVLFEQKETGYTPNYILVKKKTKQNLANKIINVKI
ncbi:MAG: tRNA (N(6)-L-threonylcarbamoyladenosine(37)-C(2))-methylthiotransferase MtaB [Patescibacteria group bacterium]|nr:tRNA (N(6)-L-threonylcarbamoyladenosine(37)-C(2))-methylthiotransferase MtaB [Patescibacteria group bacterium]